MIKELRSRTLTGIIHFKSNTYKNANPQKVLGKNPDSNRGQYRIAIISCCSTY